MKAILLFSIILSLSLQAKEQSVYYDNIGLGQHLGDNYSGPINSDFVIREQDGNLLWKDSLYYNKFFDPLLSEELFDLYLFNRVTLPEEYSCSNTSLSKNLDYTKYLYRLLHMSYLYEGMKENSLVLSKMMGQESKCVLSWQELFSDCDPKYVEMKKFLGRSKVHMEKSKHLVTDKLSSSKQKAFLEEIKDEKSLKAKFLKHEFMSLCGKNCELTVQNFAQTMKSQCRDKASMIKKICNEKDDTWGLSSSPRATELIYLSNASIVINREGYGRSCLDRFSRKMSYREPDFEYYEYLFEDIFALLSERGESYIQGELFLPGSLKEFDDKGLVDFLFVPKEEEIDFLTGPSVPEIEIKTKAQEFVQVARSKKFIENKKRGRTKSYFFKQVSKRKTTNKKVLAIDMEKFEKDLIFKQVVLEKLEKSLKSFQTQRAVQDMKVHDKLGSEKRPMSLVYLKFLLDQGKHQSLYNLTYILGERFYVVNDIDQIKEPVYIHLYSSSGNKYGWGIRVLKSP